MTEVFLKILLIIFLEFAESSFNPYQSHILRTESQNIDMKKIEQPDFDELIKAERERRDVKIYSEIKLF